MVTLEWDVPFILSTPYGDLPFNSLASSGTTPVGNYLLDSTACHAGTGRRVTRTNIPQAGGEITHRKYRTGYAMELSVQLWEDTATPACQAVLREMADYLMLHLNSIDNEDGRIRWAPSGANERMLDRVRFLGPTLDGGGGGISVSVAKGGDAPLVTVGFALLSPFPYGMDYAETDTHIADGATATLDNTGNSDFYPVLRVNGPSSGFVVTNLDVEDEDGNALQIVYDTGLPGSHTIAGGHYVEIDCFRNTVYLDGDVANRKPGIDILLSDFWYLQPGTNRISITGADVDVLWQPAYA